MIGQQIEELIALYAPTVLMAIATIINYIKIFKGLKQEDLKAELDRTKKMLESQRQQNEEIIRTQKELINEVSKVVKYEDVSTNKKV